MNQTTKKTTKPSTAPTKKAEQNWKDFDFSHIGERIKEARLAAGMEREQMADLLGISVAHYGNIERENSVSLKVLVTLLNYFATKHSFNPSWIVIKENKDIPFRNGQGKTIDNLVTELNELIKHHNLMVTMVPKT